MPPITIFDGLLNPESTLVDTSGNFFLNSEVGLESVLTIVGPDGVLIDQVSVSDSFVDTDAALDLAQDPVSGLVIALREDGILLAIDPVGSTVIPFLDVRDLDVDASAVFDVLGNVTVNLSTSLNLDSATFSGIGIGSDKGIVSEIFITGTSEDGIIPFVLSIDVGSTFESADVILASRLDSSFEFSPENVERDIAVNVLGTALTSLPTIDESGNIADVLISFDTDFNPSTALSEIALSSLEVDAQGVAADSLGNFLVATSVDVGDTEQGALVTVSPDLSQVLGLNTLEFVGNSFTDVATDPASQGAVVAVNTLTVGPDVIDSVVFFLADDLQSSIFIATDDDDAFAGTIISDVFSGGSGNDFISGLSGDDSLFGGANDDILLGGFGDDILVGGPGNDFILGGPGNDIIRGLAGDDNLAGGKGNDEIEGGNGDDVITANTGNDTLTGRAGADTITGGAGQDIIIGNAGDDTLRGSRGNDTLIGLLGSDTLIGGDGSDTFVISDVTGIDMIQDFSIRADVVSLAEDIAFDSISISDGEGGAELEAGGNTLAIFVGVSAESLLTAEFV